MVRAPLIISAITILLGTTIAEFCTSSPVRSVLVVLHNKLESAGYFTHMSRAIDPCSSLVSKVTGNLWLLRLLTNKRPRRCHQPSSPGDSVASPSTSVLKPCKYVSGRTLRCKVNQRDEQCKEETYVADECGAFDVWEDSDTENVDKHRYQEHHPIQQRCMPVLGLIATNSEYQ